MTWQELNGHHVARRRRRCAHAPVIHATSHFYHEKRVARVSISMYACDPVPIVMGLRLATLRAAGAPLQNQLHAAVLSVYYGQTE